MNDWKANLITDSNGILDVIRETKTIAVLGIRLVWTQITGQDPGAPLSVRVRALDLPARVSAGARAREYQWVPDATGRGRLLLDRVAQIPRELLDARVRCSGFLVGGHGSSRGSSERDRASTRGGQPYLGPVVGRKTALAPSRAWPAS